VLAAAPRVVPARMAAPAVTKDQLVDQSLFWDFMSYYTTGNLEDIANQYVNAIDFELKNKQADDAFEAFKANPTRASSLKAEAEDASAKSKQMKVLAGIHPSAKDAERRYKFQSYSAKMESAEDQLKNAELRMGVDADGADAYFNALANFRDKSTTWWQNHFDYTGKDHAYKHLERRSYIEGKRNGDVDDETFLNSFLMVEDGGVNRLINEGLAAGLVYQQNRREQMQGNNAGPNQLNQNW
jgi:hypothetical protein